MKRPAFFKRSILLLLQVKIGDRRNIMIPIPTAFLDEIIRSAAAFMKIALKMPHVREKIALHAPKTEGKIGVGLRLLLTEETPKILCALWHELTSYGSWTFLDIQAGNEIKVVIRFI